MHAVFLPLVVQESVFRFLQWGEEPLVFGVVLYGGGVFAWHILIVFCGKTGRVGVVFDMATVWILGVFCIFIGLYTISH